MRKDSNERRRFLQYVGAAAAAGLAGCGGGGTPTQDPNAVPAEYRTATSIGGQERSPDALSSKESVNYQEQPNDGEQCSDCTFFIPDKNGDGQGACAIVEGTISPDGWCVSYSAHDG